MEMWEPIPPGILWATPGLLRDSLTVNKAVSFMALMLDELMNEHG